MYAKWVIHANAQQIPLQFRAAVFSSRADVQCHIICRRTEQLVGKILSYLRVLVMLNDGDFWSILNTQTTA